jgi:hypothetical protein
MLTTLCPPTGEADGSKLPPLPSVPKLTRVSPSADVAAPGTPEVLLADGVEPVSATPCFDGVPGCCAGEEAPVCKLLPLSIDPGAAVAGLPLRGLATVETVFSITIKLPFTMRLWRFVRLM